MAKYIGIAIASFALALGVLTYTRPAPETTTSRQTESATATSVESSNRSSGPSHSRKLPSQLDEVINFAKTTIEMLQAKRFAHDKSALVTKLKQVRSELGDKVEKNRHRLMSQTLRDSKTLLGMTTKHLEQGEITSAEAQEIAVITFQGIAKQAKSTREFEVAKDKLSEKMKGHEQSLFDAAMKGVKRLKE